MPNKILYKQLLSSADYIYIKNPSLGRGSAKSAGGGLDPPLHYHSIKFFYNLLQDVTYLFSIKLC